MQPFLRYLAAFLTSTLIALLAIKVSASPFQACGPVFTQNFDGVTPPALPSGWVASQGVNVTGAPFWVTSTVTPQTPPNAAFSTAPDNILDNRLDTPVLPIIPTQNVVTFWHSYNLESGLDGAVLEISSPNINGGVFTDVTAAGGQFNGGGYNTTISAGFQSPIAGRMAWSGNSGGYIFTQLFFPMVTFTQAKLRFRLASDNAGASAGWRIDTFSVVRTECSSPTPTPPVTPSPTPTVTPTVTPTATIFPTATPTASDCPGVCGSPTPSPTVTPTATPSATPTVPPTPTPTPSPTATPSPAQALNISTRLRAETGDRVIIGGFIITGNVPKKVAIRGVGPSLANSGLSDVLADPTLELFDSDSLLTQNDDWQDDPVQAAQLTALGLALQHPKESGIVTTLPPGHYTVLVAGKNQTSGIGLVEIYDADMAAASQLANISTRGFVRTGDNVMIGGFILGHGSGSANVIIRALGPSLSHFMLPDFVADPTLELRDANGALLIANDDWQGDPASAAQLIAYGLQPSDPAESGIFASLAPGAFTAIVAGKNGDVGIALVEVYKVADQTFVTTTADSGPGSLREAIARARDGDTIQFSAALNGQTIILTSAELLIDKSITIKGNSTVQRSTAGGTPAFRIFQVTPGHTVMIQGLTISNGLATGGSPGFWGGGIYNDGSTLTVANCVISGNSAGGMIGFGGGIFNNANNSGHADLTISNSTVSGNSASNGGGGVYSNGAGQLHHATVVLNGSTISGNSASSGAGIFNNGYSFGDASLIVNNSTISGNAALNGGGGIYNLGQINSSNTSVTVSNSTISGNSARFGGASVNDGLDGSATVEVAHSTISDNSAVEQGGGLYNTLGTTAARSGGGIYPDGPGGTATVLIRNTILKAGLSGENIYNHLSEVTSGGYNLSSDNGGGFLTAPGDQINTNPMLGPLQDNFGPTLTHKLLTGSPAIDAGDPNFAPPPFNDQRGPGAPRVMGGRLDIGSFESQP